MSDHETLLSSDESQAAAEELAATLVAATADPFAKGGDRSWLWWADGSYLRPGLYLRRRRILRVSMWLLRPRYSWNVRGYGRRWS